MNHKMFRKNIPPAHRIVLAKLAETINISEKYLKIRYLQYDGDPQVFIEDIKYLINCLQNGTMEFNRDKRTITILKENI